MEQLRFVNSSIISEIGAIETEVKIKKAEIQLYAATIEELLYVPGKDMAIIVAENKARITEVVREINKQVSMPDDLRVDAYRKAEKELAIHHSAKQPNGQPRYNDSGQIMIANIENYNRDLTELRKSHHEAVTIITNLREIGKKVLDEEIAFKLLAIPYGKVSSEITAVQWQAMQFMVIPPMQLDLG